MVDLSQSQPDVDEAALQEQEQNLTSLFKQDVIDDVYDDNIKDNKKN